MSLIYQPPLNSNVQFKLSRSKINFTLSKVIRSNATEITKNMKTSYYTKGALVLFSLFFTTVLAAQNKVVVIPMAGDDLRTVYEIGKTGPAGGIVIHVTDGGLHGLEASHEDQSASAEWGCFGIDILTMPNISSAATPDPNTGAYNTQQIIATGCGASSAAAVASAYMGPNGITTDWYLPNKEELNLLYNQKHVVGGFASGGYWSSSESSSGMVWIQLFDDGVQLGSGKNFPLSVRAVRAF
ncbi:DUF1566 domain-containing protein [Arenicella xantha]|uniref:Uncharacterized protein DUF1566 n=1 Tax=Arenicella xantha TaxID=644221 RepID=A0A395JLL0_9GAMM|nr:DUF1566 domain-containing protein [Arenicella xantha]RBP51686.1 uncharacterized protein DUF1566 [Arenicella xantha]